MTRSLKAENEQPGYLSYLLRIWQIDTGPPGNFSVSRVWRVSIENSLTGERQGFADLNEFIMFLLKQTGSTTSGDEQGS